MMFCGFINVSVHIPVHGLNDCWRFHLCLTETLVMGSVSDITSVSWLASSCPGWQIQKENNVNSTVYTKPQSQYSCLILKSSLGEKYMLAQLLVCLITKNGGKSLCDIILSWYLVSLTGTRELHLWLERRLILFFVPTCSRLHQCLQCHVLTSSNHVAHSLINKHQHYDYSHHTISYKNCHRNWPIKTEVVPY